jgi:hypothetical protein
MGMGMRVLIAGIVGGIVMFAWGAVSHMVLPLGEMGFTSLPHEETLVPAMKESLTEHGMYFFPAMPSPEMTQEQWKEWELRYNAGPVGMIVYQPQGKPMMSPLQLGTELAFNVLAALLASFVIARTASPYMVRVLCYMLIGVTAWLSISASHWNWYNFTSDFAVGELITETIGWFLIGLFAGGIVKPSIRIAASS